MNVPLTKHQLDLLGKWHQVHDDLYKQNYYEKIRAKKREERSKKVKEIFE